MKKIISLFLTVTMIASLIIAIPVTNVAAAETITDEALFMTYPTYLSNSEMDEGLAKAEAAYYAVINSYSDSDETVAKAVTMLSEGVDIAFNEALSVLGITHNYYETCAKKAAKKYMQSMLQNENVLKKATKKVQTAYKEIKTVYSTATVVAKEELIIDLTKVAAENDIGISTKAMDAYVKSAYESGTLKNDLDAIGAVNDLWKYVIEFSELHAIEMTTLDMLMEELLIAGQGDSDLFIGLGLLKEDIAKDEYYILENYATKTVISLLSEFVDELIGNVTGSVHLSLIKGCIKIFCDYVYVNAKADEITQAIIQTSFVNSVDICLSKYRQKFLQGTGTTSDIEMYENLYALSISARIAILDTCYDVTKIADKFSLGGDCMVWKDMLEYNYTYDNYIKWCKEAVAHDIASAELDKITGESTITDALNEETIKARLDEIRADSRYKPNVGNTFSDAYQTEGTLGFAARVFNCIFDKEMGKRVEKRYNHILTNNKNVRVIGRLEENEVTISALKEMFAKVRIGDILLTSGQYDYLHAMVVISVDDDGVIVYDCDSKYTPDASKDMNRFEIREYKISYEKMADAFSENGVYMSVPGISVYRAINKVNTTNSGSSLYYEMYDDSANYVIEDGVLIGYNGLQTKLKIPDGVTEIADNCFNNNDSIRSVYMPDSVKIIGESAFYNCDKLKEIRFSPNLTIIKSDAFYWCPALRTIAIAGNPEIESQAFRGCGLLSNILLEDSVLKIGGLAFYDTAWYRSQSNSGDDIYLDHVLIETVFSEENALVIKEGTKAIAEDALEVSYQHESLYIPESLEYWYCVGDDLENITTVYYNAIDCEFQNAVILASNVKNLYIGENVSKVGQYNFSSFFNVENLYYNAKNCTRFKEKDNYDLHNVSNIVIGNKVQSIPDYAFASTSIRTISIPESVTKIGNGAFYGTDLFSVTIPDTVTEMGHSVFGDCFSLSNITLSDSITEIGPNSFENTSLNSFTVPASVKAIDASSFYNTPLSKFIVDERNENYSAIDGILYNKSGDTLEIVPGSLFSLKIPKECKNIKPYAFNNVRFLMTINVESGNTAFKISDGALYSADMKVLVRWIYDMSNPIITIPEGTKIIYGNAFNNINYMTDIYLPASIETIGYNAFYRDSKLKNVHYNDAEVAWKAIDIDSNGNEALLGAEFHYLQITGTKITTLRVDDKGKVTLAVANAPADAVAYVASYDALGKLLELQNLTLNNGVVGTSFSTSGVYKYKAFIWKGDTVKPISDSKEYIFK